MANLKFTFVPHTVILSAEINTNFDRIENGNIPNEDLTLQIDGIKTVFTIANDYIAGSIKVFVNGLKRRPTIDFSESSSTTITTLFASPLQSGDILTVEYIKKFSPQF